MGFGCAMCGREFATPLQLRCHARDCGSPPAGQAGPEPYSVTLRARLRWYAACLPTGSGRPRIRRPRRPATRPERPTEVFRVLRAVSCSARPGQGPGILAVPPGALLEVDAQTAGWGRLSAREAEHRAAPGELWVPLGELRREGGLSPQGVVWMAEDTLRGLPRPELSVAPDPTPERSSSLLAEVCRALEPSVLEAARADGFAIVDGVLSPESCARLRAEMARLEGQSLMWQSSSYNSANACANSDSLDPQRQTIQEGINPLLNHGILETSLGFRRPDGKAAGSEAPLFAAIERDASMMSVLTGLVPGLNLQELRIQVNQGTGGCYGIHIDGEFTTANANGLRLTALFYLNHGWKQEHGGELLLLPFPHPPVKIAPLEGRLVLLDPSMAHGVLPSRAKRYCFTLWLHKQQSNAPDPVAAQVPAQIKALPNVLKMMAIAQNRFSLVRMVHADMYRDMLELSHPAGAETDALLADLDKEVDWFRQKLLSPWSQQLADQIQWPPPDGELAEGQVGPARIAEIIRQVCGYWSRAY